MRPVTDASGIAAAKRAFTCAMFVCCVGLMPFATPVSVTLTAQDRPPKGKVGVFVAVDVSHAVNGNLTRQADAEESATELRTRGKTQRWIKLADRAEDGELLVTITGRRKDPDKGFVLSYILEAGDYKGADEFSFEGRTELTGGIRTLGSDGRTSVEGRRTISWDDLAKQFARS